MKVNHPIFLDALRFYLDIKTHRSWSKNQFDSQIGPLMFESRFNTKEFKTRVLNYSLQSHITNNWFSTLHNIKIGFSDQQRAFLAGVLTPYVDDLMDEERINATEVLNKVCTPDSPDPLSNWITYHLKEEFAKNPDWEKMFLEVMAAQQHSLEQRNGKDLSFNRLVEITRNKGGKATLFYRMILPYPITKNEQEFIMELGFILQLTNDLFDVYKDVHAGIGTLVTKFGPDRTREIYSTSLERMKGLFNKLQFNEKRKKAVWRKMMMVVARGAVCLDMHEDLIRKTAWEPGKYNRSQLICDMEKPANILKNLRYAARYSANVNTIRHQSSL